MITGCFIAFVASIGVYIDIINRDGPGYSVSLFFMILGAGPASCVGLQMLQDISFAHERAQKVGVWTFTTDAGLLLGLVPMPFIPILIFGLLVFSFLVFLPETAFPRQSIQQEEAAGKAFGIPDPTNVEPDEERTRLRLNLRRIPGLVTPRPWDYILRFFHMFTFPNVAVSTILYAWGWMGTFYFALALVNTPPHDGDQRTSFHVGLVGGIFLSEIFFSGTLSDIIVKYITKRRKIPRNPEMRLWLMWPAGVLSVLGLLLCALSILKSWNSATTIVFLTICAVGVQMGNTTTVTYALDCHPEHALSVAVFYSVHTNMAALVFLFYPSESWMYDVLFFSSGEAQAIITGCSFILSVGFLQLFGGKVRDKRGPFPWTPAQ
ncbi:hypothetical protein FRB99_000524 [Tulasnella sp. 403]|nr:hypothetical protein FRB99_000524 [Tulasnella sp. 403]